MRFSRICKITKLNAIYNWGNRNCFSLLPEHGNCPFAVNRLCAQHPRAISSYGCWANKRGWSLVFAQMLLAYNTKVLFRLHEAFNTQRAFLRLCECVKHANANGLPRDKPKLAKRFARNELRTKTQSINCNTPTHTHKNTSHRIRLR